MWKIRSAQMDIFAAATRRHFENRVVAYLGAHYPTRATELGAEGLRRIVGEAIAKGREYGIRSERNVARLAVLMVAIDPAFDVTGEFAWARGILAHPAATEESKLGVVCEQLAVSAPHLRLPA